MELPVCGLLCSDDGLSEIPNYRGGGVNGILLYIQRRSVLNWQKWNIVSYQIQHDAKIYNPKLPVYYIVRMQQ